MSEDDDDTVIVSPRPVSDAAEPDLDDTVVPSRAARAGAPAEPTVAAPTNSHYSFRVGEGAEIVPLDRPCYIGRRPSSPRVAAGVVPRLVRVASPLREVSATHLELRQVGASVIATDLRSTNGSIVMLPGSAPRKLRQGESVVVSPGTLVDIGDGNILQILPMQRLGQSQAGRQS